MTMTVLVLVPLLVLAVVAVFAFAGCDAFTASETGPVTVTGPPLVIAPPDPPVVVPPAPVAKNYPEVILAEPGLRCYWRFTEPAGAVTAVDSEPTLPQAGTYVDTIEGVGGVLALGKLTMDTAVNFDAISSHVDVPYHEQVNPGLNFSVEVWIRPEVNSDAPNTIAGSYNPQKSHGYILELLRQGGVISVRARIGNGTTFNTATADLGDATAHDGWRHVVMTYKATPAELNLYVHAGGTLHRGQLLGQSYIPVQDPVAAVTFRIGAGRLTAANTPPRLGFRGRIDEVALYDAVLAEQTVKDHYAVALTP